MDGPPLPLRHARHGSGTVSDPLPPRSHLPGPALGPGGEFDLIRRLIGRGGPLPPELRVGPGDDAAVLEGGWCLSSDLAIEEVHFRRDWLTAREIGARAVAAALSDLAAMAARPVAILLSMALPSPGGAELAEELQEGAAGEAARFGAVIAGGDLSRSPGPIVVDVTVIGRTPHPVLRSGALPGDEVWVTGALGGAAGAVRLWLAGEVPPPALRQAFAHPTPRISEALWLAGEGCLRAALDLSDGVAGDAGHLAAAGGVRVVIEAGLVPLHPALLSGDFSEAVRLELALGGGEDYELCLITPPGALAGRKGEFEKRFGVPLTRIGRVESGAGVEVRDEPGRSAPRVSGGFSHFTEGV